MGFLSFYKQLQPRGYANRTFLIEDTSATSPLYFDVTEFPQSVGGGRYVIKFRGNGLNLRTGSPIDIEAVDSEGKNMYVELLNYTDRFNNYYAMVEIYDITPQGLATIYLVGEAAVDPNGRRILPSNQPSPNVRWSRSFNVLPFERNTAELLFDKPPLVSITQVITPERALTSQESASLQGSNFSVYTSSISDYTVLTSNFQGYDLDFASSPDILDKRLRSLLINPEQKPTTENSVDSSIRTKLSEIQNGYQRGQTNRFNTIVKSTNRTIRKDFLGGSFSFYDSGSTPTRLKPTLPTNYTVSGSIATQLQTYTANIVEVLSDTEMRITKPIELVVRDSNSIQKGYNTKFTYREASNFTASIAYLPNNPTYVTSSLVSQSYLEVTFADFKPVSGEVYRIKTYYKRGIATADYKLIYDQIVTPIEYLTDAAYPNQTTYARRESDGRLIGHFTAQNIADEYWDTFVESPGGVYVNTIPVINSSSLYDSLPIRAAFTESGVLATKFYQNYSINQIYTLGFNVTLEPNTHLEVYMGSDPLNTNTYQPQAYARAFLRDSNLEKTRYGDAYSRFGQFVGRISNTGATTKNYGRVEFDFETDGEGLGRPVFRVVTDQYTNITGSAYLSEIGIKPIAINGFNPNLVQFAIPFNNEITDIIALSQSLDFKIDYFDYTGKQSEFTTYINDLVVNLKGEIPSNTCQAETNYFYIPVNREQY